MAVSRADPEFYSVIQCTTALYLFGMYLPFLYFAFYGIQCAMDKYLKLFSMLWLILFTCNSAPLTNELLCRSKIPVRCVTHSKRSRFITDVFSNLAALTSLPQVP